MKMLIFMAIGILVGLLFGEQARILRPLGDLFIRLLLMAAIPLVFFNLVAGLSNLSDFKAFGRLGGKVLFYFLSTSIIALTLGLVAMHLLKPGIGMSLAGPAPEALGAVPGVGDLLLDLVPKNIFAAFSNGKVAQIVVFALLLGLATLSLPDDKRLPLTKLFAGLAELLRKLVELILYFGPLGIGALAAATVGEYGASIFGPLSLFITGVWAAQITMVVIYMILLIGFTRHSPLNFLKQTAPLYATTATTCSSLASLVISYEMAQVRLRLPKHIYTFTLPLCTTLNIDGTSIMLTGVLLFTAQAAGVTFNLASHVNIVLVGLSLSLGASGIPGGGLVIALIFVQAFNLPVEIAAVVGGIYRLLDIGNTTVNCMGDLVGTTIIAHFERDSKEIDDQS